MPLRLFWSLILGLVIFVNHSSIFITCMLSMLPRTHSIPLELQSVKALWHGQFLPLQQLQDESNPDFVVEVVFLFFDDSKKLLNDLTIAFIAAQRVKNACIAFCNFFEEQNIATCLRCLQQLYAIFV
ncbi:Uncharacterized protein TCM_017055 [Theobroma cacao]|uniref:Histidine-containing phosphotransfer protein n=1 Tax=Theobroma cacao TaxID=3641 RepID=A0A061ECJ1_THECC|nr:Uncharacterized protein TCM_017055 [Theobroma cacao]